MLHMNKHHSLIFKRSIELLFLLIALAVFITHLFDIKVTGWDEWLGEAGSINRLLILEAFAALSVPCILFFNSWLRKETESVVLKKIVSIIDSKAFFYLCMCLAAGGIALLIYYSFSPAFLMIDEADTFAALKLDYVSLTQLTAKDVHPPLYYWLAKFLSNVLCQIYPMQEIYAVRLVSIIPNILLVILCATVVRRWWGNMVAGIACIALVAMPQFQFFGICIRMYSWGLFWVTSCYLCSYSVMRYNRWRDWVIFAVTGLGAAWTHNFACVAAAFPYLYLAVWSIRKGRNHIIKWFVAAAVTVLGFSPWLTVLLEQASHVSNGFWIPEVTWSRLIWIILAPFTWWLPLLICIGVLAAVLRHHKSDRRTELRYATLGILTPVFIIVFGYIYSLINQPILMDRYVFQTYGCMWLGCSIAVHYLRSDRLKIAFVIMIMWVAGADSRNFARQHHTMKHNTRQFINHFNNIPSAKFAFTVQNGLTYPFYMLTRHDMLICAKLNFWHRLVHPQDRVHEIQSIGEGVRHNDNVYFVALDVKDKNKLLEISKIEDLSIGKEEIWCLGNKRYSLFPLKSNEQITAQQVANHLVSMRLDAKNKGDEKNTLIIQAQSTKVTQPAWFTNKQGIGSVLESNELKQIFTLTAIKDGMLQLSFRGADRRKDGKRFPLWIDYKSIKIDGEEILSTPVSVWHDKPYYYEMPVKDGQKITVEIEQIYHPYSKEELKDIILKLNPKSDFISKYLDIIADLVLDIISQSGKTEQSK